MKIVTLMEDTKGSCSCKEEHGLSFYIETDHHKLLMDTGASSLTWDNASILGVDLEGIDTVVISHGHYDHTGGLMSLQTKADIYMQRSASNAYYHGEKYIGIDQNILTLPNLHLMDGNLKIDDELSIFSNITGRKYWPLSNLSLSEQFNGNHVQDAFKHEQCLVIENNDKKVLISGCAHNGILNILEQFNVLYSCFPDVVLSGFHMMKKGEYTQEEIRIIQDTAKELSKLPTVFYTGHCTGQRAFDFMKDIMKDQLIQLHVGDCISI